MSNPLKQPCTIEVVSIVLQLTAIAAVFSTAVFCTKGAVLLCFLLQLVLSPSHACEVTPKPLRFHIEGVTWIEVG